MVPIGTDNQRPLALVTGASTGIGRALAHGFIERGHDVVVAADEDTLLDTAAELKRLGASVFAQQVDLTEPTGVDRLYEAVVATGRPVTAAALNAGVGASGHFWKTPLEADLAVVDLNVRAVVHLTKLLLPPMVAQGEGRLLFTGSVAGLAPGPYHATYAASKAFVNLFAEGLRHELKGTGVTVTALMPGPTETAFFDRAEMRDTIIGRMPKDDPGKVAAQALEALFAGREHVVSGSILNRVGALGSGLLPDWAKAHVQAVFTKPRSGDR